MFKRIALTVIAAAATVAFASPAQASTGWVCADIEQRGAMYMLYDAVQNHGYSSEADAQKLVGIIIDQCPEHLGEVVQAAEKLGG